MQPELRSLTLVVQVRIYPAALTGVLSRRFPINFGSRLRGRQQFVKTLAEKPEQCGHGPEHDSQYDQANSAQACNF